MGENNEFGPACFINRELSWLDFNERVLEEAEDLGNPLLERVKFFTIFNSNLDEFFEIRVAGLKQQIEALVAQRSADGLTPAETLAAVQARVRQLVNRQYRCWREDLVPALIKSGIRFPQIGDLKTAERTWVDNYYQTRVRPVLTPLAVDSSHPFPQLLNKSLNLIVQLGTLAEDQSLEMQRGYRLAIVQLPRILPRLIRLPGKAGAIYLFLGRLMGHYLGDLFPGMKILGYWLFRVTRNSELYIDEEETENLLNAVEQELQKQRRGEAVRLEVEKSCPPEIRDELLTQERLSQEDLYLVDGPISPGRLMILWEECQRPELKDTPFVGIYSAPLKEAPDLFAAIRKQDVLLHHPYESFEPVIEFLEQAAEDPRVLAIKQTLYRTGADKRLIGALMRAANNGKQVSVVVELRARFDEENNIDWARKLEDAGVHVVYGLVGLKIHGKLCLVVRREEDGLRRYLHLSSGNYNPTTARIYTDLGLFTCHPDFGEDATNLFNLLTGICQFPGMRRLLVAPFTLHQRMLELVNREAEHARQGLPALIRAKMNSLVDREIIEALYRASQAGVTIQLLVRGICCLRPQVKGISDNITVGSVVDRFLEHSRIFYFANACQPEVLVSSADWMPRNFFRRIEVAFPILDGNLHDRLCRQILDVAWADNTKARFLGATGGYQKAPGKPGATAIRSQYEFMRRAAQGEVLDPQAKPGKGGYPRVKVRTKPPGREAGSKPV